MLESLKLPCGAGTSGAFFVSGALIDGQGNILREVVTRGVREDHLAGEGTRNGRPSAEHSGGAVEVDADPIIGDESPEKRLDAARTLHRESVGLVDTGVRQHRRTHYLDGVNYLNLLSSGNNLG